MAQDFAEWSPYNYVLGNPVRLVDPDGRASKPPKITYQSHTITITNIKINPTTGYVGSFDIVEHQVTISSSVRRGKGGGEGSWAMDVSVETTRITRSYTLETSGTSADLKLAGETKSGTVQTQTWQALRKNATIFSDAEWVSGNPVGEPKISNISPAEISATDKFENLTNKEAEKVLSGNATPMESGKKASAFSGLMTYSGGATAPLNIHPGAALSITVLGVLGQIRSDTNDPTKDIYLHE